MKNNVMMRSVRFQKKRQKRSRWRKAILCLGAMVALSLTYAAASAAMTMEDACQLPEHTHSEACYERIEAEPHKTPVCTKSSLNIHRHTGVCKNADGVLACGYADFVVHQHDDSCHDENGELWCDLPEIKTHTHKESCYAQADVSNVHQHTSDCYVWEQGALICGEEEREGHTHSEAECYTMTSTLVCEIPESNGHEHDASCYDKENNEICGVEQGSGAHRHGEGCYELTHALTCTLPEDKGHHHSAECYEKVQGELTCTLSTEPPEPTLVCTKEEIILHEHKSSCFDENGWPICGKRQVLEHEHSDACFEIVRDVVETLTCGMEEHTHTEECHIAAPMQEPTDTIEEEPTEKPTEEPTDTPAEESTGNPTEEPTDTPAEESTGNPTEEPTGTPVEESTGNPTEEPTDTPAEGPAENPTEELTDTPAGEHTENPTDEPTGTPVEEPTENLTDEPTGTPVEEPTENPTDEPTDAPVGEPTGNPTEEPIGTPTELPTVNPTEEPTDAPTEEPTIIPMEEPVEPAGEELIATPSEMEEGHHYSALNIPEEWPVMGYVYGSAMPRRRAAARARTGEAPNEGETEPVPEPTPANTEPLNMKNYVTNTTLLYRIAPNPDWQEVTKDTVLPGSADLRLQIHYEHVNIDNLLTANREITYLLPDIMREPSQGKLTTTGPMNETIDVGIITAKGKKVTLTYDEKWLNDQKTALANVINGDFNVDARIDISKVPADGKTELIFGDVKIAVNFEPDIVAKSAKIDLQKSTPKFISDKSGNHYLEYTLTITAGEDGAPQVRVEDAFTGHGEYIESYVGVSAEAKTTSGNAAPNPVETMSNAPADAQNGTVSKQENSPMVWNIGDMEPNENRTLTYRVMLKKDYTEAASTDTITNTAKPYSKDNEKTSVVSNFQPTINASITKKSATFTPNKNGDGGGTITYTVWIHADANNTYTLENVKIEDALDGYHGTDGKYLPYLSYDEKSFGFYNEGDRDQNGSEGLQPLDDGNTPVVAESKHSFARYVGSLKPGESRTLTYTVKVEPGAFIAAGNSDIPVNNHASFSVPNKELGSCDNDRTISKKVWSRKLVGERQERETIIDVGEAYRVSGDSVTKEENPGSFTVPPGSYQYQIVANEAGDWDLSSASMTDQLSGGHMQFIGYVRVDAYTITDNAPTADLTDQAAIANLKGQKLDKTVWVHADKGLSFAFKPQDIGLEKGKHAYLLTYYAEPVSMDGVTQVKVMNTFSIGGIDGDYLLTGVKVNASVIVEGANGFGAQKMSWYYEKPKEKEEERGNYTNGAIYWVIKVDGTVIPEGTVFRDETEVAGAASHSLYEDSVVGLYTGNLGEMDANDYDNLNELLKSQKLTRLGSDNYSTNIVNDKTMTIQLLKDVELEGDDFLYAIIKTNPWDVPTGIRETKTYKNKLKSSYNGKDWIDYPEASQVLGGSSGVFKELNRLITWDGKTAKLVKDPPAWDHTHDDLLYNEMAPGVYAIWHVQANYLANLKGKYRFVETIPEGMELAYVSHYWYGPNYGSTPPRSVEIANLDDEWTKYEKEKKGVKCIYYTKGRQVIWEVDGLVDGSALDVDGYGAEYQIACRVTDTEVLFDHVAKDFTNKVTLLNEHGKEAGTCSDTVNVSITTLTKADAYNAQINGGRYPFIITVNPLGEDLASASDKITLVDVLSDTLMLDATSVKVKDKDGNLVTDWTLSMNADGQSFELELPDGKTLTITYEAVVNAPPGQAVKIVNRAYWKGHSYTGGQTVEKTDFKYTVSGTVESATRPSLKIIKMDQNDVTTRLPDVGFTLQEVTYDETSKSFSPVGSEWPGVTGTDGTLTFGTDPNQIMKFDTIYRLIEKNAPSGYVTDGTPHYIAIAKDKKAGQFPVLAGAKLTVWYQSAEMIYQVRNHKGEITVAKEFKNAGGDSQGPVHGTYTFGLYEQPDASVAQLQKVSITYQRNDTERKTATFKNLELTKTYYVFELDDEGKPIMQNGQATIADKRYLVTYASTNQASNAVNAAMNGQTVTVSNQSFSVELPHTGGTGTALYALGGLLLTVCAGALLANRKKCQEG